MLVGLLRLFVDKEIYRITQIILCTPDLLMRSKSLKRKKSRVKDTHGNLIRLNFHQFVNEGHWEIYRNSLLVLFQRLVRKMINHQIVFFTVFFLGVRSLYKKHQRLNQCMRNKWPCHLINWIHNLCGFLLGVIIMSYLRRRRLIWFCGHAMHYYSPYPFRSPLPSLWTTPIRIRIGFAGWLLCAKHSWKKKLHLLPGNL